MALRRWIILALTILGVFPVWIAAPVMPEPWGWFVHASGWFLLAYVYAQLTRPKGF